MILGIDASQANRKVRSGTEWYAFYLIQEFKKLIGGRSDVWVRLYLRDTLREDLARDLPKNFQSKILRWPFKYFWGQIRLSWEMFFDPPDILFCPAHTIPLAHPPKTYTTLHDVGFEDYPELYDKLLLWYHRWAAKLAVKRAFQIFSVSEFSKERIIEVYNYQPKKIFVTYLGYDQTKFKSLDPSLVAQNLQKLGLGYKDYLLFLGRLEPKKNILNLVKAYEYLLGMVESAPELVLVGKKVNISDVESYLIERPDLSSKIKFLGYVEEADKPVLYLGAALFLFPTLYEGFGLPIIEAQACGVPVVTSNTASNPEIAGEGAVIIDPESPYEIAQVIRELLTNQKLCEQKINLGFDNVKKLSWQETAEKTLVVMGIID